MSESQVLASIGFLIDFEYGFDWKNALKIAGWPEHEESWKEFVASFNTDLPDKTRSATTDRQNPTMGTCNPDGKNEVQIKNQAAWEARINIKERTVGHHQNLVVEHVSDAILGHAIFYSHRHSANMYCARRPPRFGVFLLALDLGRLAPHRTQPPF